MSKNILIFSDGTGQRGGLRPDQRLSNIYKMYRAMRPGPESPIPYSEQVAFYDPGLGAGEVGGFWSGLRRLRNIVEAAVGTGIDSNMIDCYEKIIASYEPGDRVMLFGFSRGAYTVRALANVMKLCGVPTQLSNGDPIPRDGPALYEIAHEAVKSVYGHGAGKPRDHPQYKVEREEKGRRFREKYGSAPPPDQPDIQGNVQPHFIGVFDTVAALGDRVIASVCGFVFLVAVGFSTYFYSEEGSSLLTWLTGIATAVALFWYLKVFISQIRYFEKDPENPRKLFYPWHWPAIYKHTHRASWNRDNYDRYLDPEVQHARHAMSIDENREAFPRVKWVEEDQWLEHKDRSPLWIDQVWFAGCHSDIGGSYEETESRLSDIAMDWMMEELETCFPTVRFHKPALHMSPDAQGLQHDEIIFMDLWLFKIPWPKKPREIKDTFKLHPSVIERLRADKVPLPGKLATYRPPQLRNHPDAREYYEQS